MFHKETRMDGGAQGNGSFVRGAVDAAMKNGTYVSSLGDSEPNQSKNQTGCTGTTTTIGTATTGGGGSGGGGETKWDDVSHTGIRMFSKLVRQLYCDLIGHIVKGLLLPWISLVLHDHSIYYLYVYTLNQIFEFNENTNNLYVVLLLNIDSF